MATDLEGRDGLQKALRMIQRGEADTLLFKRISRAGRDIVDNLVMHRTVSEAGGKLHSVEDGPIANTSEGTVMLALLSYQAEKDWHNIVQQLQDGRRDRVARGRMLVSVPLYGYRFVDAVGEKYHSRAAFAIDEETAQTIRDMFSKAEEGWSAARIATWLNENGIPTRSQLLAKRGQAGDRTPVKHWAATRVREILRNPSYCGRHAAYRNVTSRPKIRNADGTMKKTVRHKLREEGQTVAIAIPAIVDEAQWLRVQEMLKERQPASVADGSNPALLVGGFAVCGMCGARMMAVWEHPNNGTRRYVCTQRSGTPNINRPVCPGRAFAVRASDVDEDIWNRVKAIIKDRPRYLRLVRTKEEEQAGQRAESMRWLETVARELAETKALQARVYDRMVREDDEGIAAQHRATLKQLNETVARLEKRTSDLHASLDDIMLQQDAHQLLRALADSMVEPHIVYSPYDMPQHYAFVQHGPDDLDTALDAFTRENKRKILRALKVEVRMFPVKSDWAQTNDKRWDFTWDDMSSPAEVSSR
jgi:DNA invertase Pin-like site-specific DNA recombinase